VVAPSDNSLESNSINSFNRTGDGVIIDIGTGDGHYVYQSARQNPTKFYIGIDANTRPLRKVSEKIYRKVTKGGAPNALFIQASVEDLPTELDGVADEVHVHFPWGSLLKAVANGELKVLHGIRRICGVDALLEIVIGIDPERDAAEIERLGLEQLSDEYINHELRNRYLLANLEIVEHGLISNLEVPTIKSSWAQRLRGNSSRSIVYWIARAIRGDSAGLAPDKRGLRTSDSHD
jgi:16S rRNA (adenine(1408)-N(1))-methyltransferase